MAINKAYFLLGINVNKLKIEGKDNFEEKKTNIKEPNGFGRLIFFKLVLDNYCIISRWKVAVKATMCIVLPLNSIVQHFKKNMKVIFMSMFWAKINIFFGRFFVGKRKKFSFEKLLVRTTRGGWSL